MTNRTRIANLRRHRVGLGALLLVGGLIATVASSEIGGQGADAATAGLSVTPATGTSNGSPISVAIPTKCPADAAKYSVSISGAGFAAGSNIIGLSEYLANAVGPFNGGGNWDAVAGNNPGTTIVPGTATIEFLCINAAEDTILETYTGSVTFSTGTGTLNYVTPTPSPTPTPSVTPTPTPSVTPTPTPSVTPTPTPTPSVTPTPTPTPTSEPATSASQILPANGSVATNTVVTTADPIGTAVTTPVAGPVSIIEAPVPAGTQPPTGYTLLGQQVTIVAPSASAASPLHLQFRLDSSVLGGGTVPTVFRNGVAVKPCTNVARPAAAPNPCAEPMQNLGDGDLLLVVRTSDASLWNFGYPTTPPPPVSITAACRGGAPALGGYALQEGTSNDDVLIGTPGADILRGLGGDDILIGLAGNDILCAGAGNDLASGGNGHDIIRGDMGMDLLYGGAGHDLIEAGDGADLADGGNGNDLIFGGNGGDLLFGGGGNDRLFGGNGNDRLYGDEGFDRLYGGPGIDVLMPGRRVF